ncbi:hypothetical protein [Bacillus sp. V59.32b]|uniref:hypothetical protein n=1 Tax=Bacillus sp. V59.32b TaxID=1758642 RepID=UPI000E3CDAD6|nr:hypothetical protein [Bacillus sp. V59.32b]RFU63613.1 hypothetical protein D0463_11710 [Bacillus sp. V59.32b]
MQEVFDLYNKIKKVSKSNKDIDSISNLFFELYIKNCEFLSSTSQVNLISKVPTKQYFSFSYNNKISRAVNKGSYIPDQVEVYRIFNNLVNGDYSILSPEEITKCLYTISISFCCTIDLLKQGDQKTPGTFFEYFISHWFSRILELRPTSRVDVLNLDMRTSLPTDFIYDLGQNKPKIHLPVKTSTRERVIQVWAHQKLLDGVYGVGRFLGMLVCLTETKVDKKSKEVIEICVPEQWRLYQMYIAQMDSIYYLDVPIKYFELNNIYPPIRVKQFGEFFYDIQTLIEDGNYNV